MVGIFLFFPILFIILSALVVFWGINTRNRLVHVEELVNNSLSQISVQQESRWDVLTSISKLISKYSEYEASTIEKVVASRTGKASLDEINETEKNYGGVASKLNVLAEAYPDLKANNLYQDAIESLNKHEKDLKYSKMVYNDTITKYNRQIKMFPSSIVAGMFGFGPKEYLVLEENKKDIPEI